MKKSISTLIAAFLIASTAAFAGCDNSVADPGTPPEEVIRPQQSETASGGNAADSVEAENGSTENDSSEIGEENSNGLLVNAVSVRIGRDGETENNITMYDNSAAGTMLDYLSNSPLLFPTYTYDDEQGFVAQTVRGSYERDDEITVTDIHAGELYLLSGNQLRLYFKDVEGADITATPIGYFANSEGLTESVQKAYNDNIGDVWNVDVYFWITKLI